MPTKPAVAESTAPAHEAITSIGQSETSAQENVLFTEELVEDVERNAKRIKRDFGEIAAYAVFPETVGGHPGRHYVTQEEIYVTPRTEAVYVSELADRRGSNGYETFLTTPQKALADLFKVEDTLYVQTTVDKGAIQNTTRVTPPQHFRVPLTENPEDSFAGTLVPQMRQVLAHKYRGVYSLEKIGNSAVTRRFFEDFKPRILSDRFCVLEETWTGRENGGMVFLAKVERPEGGAEWRLKLFEPDTFNIGTKVDGWLHELNGTAYKPIILQEMGEESPQVTIETHFAMDAAQDLPNDLYTKFGKRVLKSAFYPKRGEKGHKQIISINSQGMMINQESGAIAFARQVGIQQKLDLLTHPFSDVRETFQHENTLTVELLPGGTKTSREIAILQGDMGEVDELTIRQVRLGKFPIREYPSPENTDTPIETIKESLMGELKEKGTGKVTIKERVDGGVIKRRRSPEELMELPEDTIRQYAYERFLGRIRSVVCLKLTNDGIKEIAADKKVRGKKGRSKRSGVKYVPTKDIPEDEFGRPVKGVYGFKDLPDSMILDYWADLRGPETGEEDIEDRQRAGMPTEYTDVLIAVTARKVEAPAPSANKLRWPTQRSLAEQVVINSAAPIHRFLEDERNAFAKAYGARTERKTRFFKGKRPQVPEFLGTFEPVLLVPNQLYILKDNEAPDYVAPKTKQLIDTVIIVARGKPRKRNTSWRAKRFQVGDYYAINNWIDGIRK